MFPDRCENFEKFAGHRLTEGEGVEYEDAYESNTEYERIDYEDSYKYDGVEDLVEEDNKICDTCFASKECPKLLREE